MSGSDLAGSGRIETKDDRGHECGRHTLVEHHREHRVFIDGRRHVFNHEIGAGLRDILAPERDLFGSAAFEIHLADALAQRFNIDLGHRVILSILTLLSPARFLNTSITAADRKRVVYGTRVYVRVDLGCRRLITKTNIIILILSVNYVIIYFLISIYFLLFI